MPKRKRGITGDAASRREAIRKRERRVAETEEERSRRLQLWHNVARTEERKKQNKIIADCQQWHNVTMREEPKKQKNKEKRKRFGGDVTFTLATIYLKKNRRRAYEN
ncbi:hypothetical protein AVEN_46514-1 [Araneus ventricosus]|uniref:Uncharacterized protein n=1 Tax=Araneus ventricosus TaxID=182803 RepID=A0A4Y2HBN1_ARAVE|nr:hypothetical protein AVEN_46514-1 [Araneus ventricosus]